jgi:hypothetical protein
MYESCSTFYVGFCIYILSIAAQPLQFALFHKKLQASKYVQQLLFCSNFCNDYCGQCINRPRIKAATLVEASYFEANNPVGTCHGLKPGRVVWVWNKNAQMRISQPSNNKTNWWAYQTNRAEVSKMFDKAILSSQTHQHYQKPGFQFQTLQRATSKGSVLIYPSEKIYIKVNITNSANE